MDNATLTRTAKALGADLVGVADLAVLHGIVTVPHDLLHGFTRAVSLAVKLSDSVLDTVADRPTPLYAQHYRIVNDKLDDMALRVSRLLEDQGARAMPLPASFTVDRANHLSFLSHKAVAVASGIAWQGKSLLAVTPQYGPRVRLATVVTDFPLSAGAPVRNRCAGCDACAKACPVGAIRGVNTAWHYASREEAVELSACAAHVGRFRDEPLIGASICGVCVKACPWGKPRRARRDDNPRGASPL